MSDTYAMKVFTYDGDGKKTSQKNFDNLSDSVATNTMTQKNLAKKWIALTDAAVGKAKLIKESDVDLS